ncbi:MAG: hypothetical protein QM811_29250 [Pirellulales bacterium]
MSNPYESPTVGSSAVRRYLWCTVIIAMWCLSAGIAGFLLGMFVYAVLPGFERLHDSPWWQVALVFGGAAALITFPLGVRRTANLNRRLGELYARRAELQDELRRRGRA